MEDKKVVPTEQMVAKIKAAVAAREKRDFFILARTDAIDPEGVDAAIQRGEEYLKAGADGVYLEGPTSETQLKRIGKAFKGEQLATSVLENGGKTPWLAPEQFAEMGYTMILYPTTLLFRAAWAIQRAAKDLRAGKPLDRDQSVNMKEFLKLVELEHWQDIEKEFTP